MEVFKEAELHGHTDLVTAISTPIAVDKTTLVTSSRDKSILVWDYSEGSLRSRDVYPKYSLLGHAHTVQDVMMSGDGTFVLSGSWDKTLRLWDLEHRKTIRIFKGHDKTVNSVAFSPSDRQIVSASRAKTVKLWNTLAECKYTFDEKNHQHQDWVSCVRFSPNQNGDSLLCVSCGWDKVVKVWNLKDCKCKSTLAGHSQALYSVTISPDGSLCASGGKDGVAMLWDVNEANNLYHLDANCPINALCFSPSNYWLCGATDKGIKIWDLEEKRLLTEIVEKNPNGSIMECTSLAWSTDGRRLFFGTRRGNLFVYNYNLKND